MEKIVILTIVFISIVCLIQHFRKMLTSKNGCSGCGHSSGCEDKNKCLN